MSEPETPPAPPVARGRIEVIDLARAVALVAMAIYHFTWDLEFFNYVPEGLTSHGGWRIFARSIASSFLFLVGVSLVLAHGKSVRWRPFLKRLAQVAAGAAAITVVTYFVTPYGYVYFGILHEIAVASVLGLAFLRLPWFVTALAALVVLLLPLYVASPIFDPMWLDWTGLYTEPPTSNDFVPIFPFFGIVLAGIAAARLARDTGVFERLRRLNEPLRPVLPLAVVGRHTLIFYLLHQPILFGLVFLFAHVFPPDLDAVFSQDCRSACLKDRGAAFCERYCACASDRLKQADLFDVLMGGEPSAEQMSRVRAITRSCSFSAAE